MRFQTPTNVKIKALIIVIAASEQEHKWKPFPAKP